MLVKTITYTNYDGLEVKENFMFNLNQAELTEWEMSEYGGLSTQLDKIINSQDTVEAFQYMKTIIMKAYGEKSPDGKRFIKSEELSVAFTQTEAYNELMKEFTTEGAEVAMSDFINGLMPADLMQQAEEQKKRENNVNPNAR